MEVGGEMTWISLKTWCHSILNQILKAELKKQPTGSLSPTEKLKYTIQAVENDGFVFVLKNDFSGQIILLNLSNLSDSKNWY